MMIVRIRSVYNLSEHFNIRHSFPMNYGEQKKAFRFSNKAGYTTNTSHRRVGRGGKSRGGKSVFLHFRTIIPDGPMHGRTKPPVESLVRV